MQGAAMHGHGLAHADAGEARSGLMILLGNSFHSLVDGVIIAAAFLQSTQLGWVTAVAIFAHTIPQQVGDFVILLYSGYSRRAALGVSLLAGMATLVGGVLAYFALRGMQSVVPYLLGIASASMIYVAVADLMPALHRRPELRATIQQMALILAGVASIPLADWLLRGL